MLCATSSGSSLARSVFSSGRAAHRLRLRLLDHLEERFRPIGEVVVESAGRRIENALDVGVGVLPVDRRQVQRALPTDLNKQLALPPGR
jgi:hypothetical protein